MWLQQPVRERRICYALYMELALTGWLSALFLGACGLPQAWKSWKEGHARGMSAWFLVLWTTGEILLVWHTVLVKDWPVTANAVFNLLVMSVIIKYKVWERKRDTPKKFQISQYGQEVAVKGLGKDVEWR